VTATNVKRLDNIAVVRGGGSPFLHKDLRRERNVGGAHLPLAILKVS
jgi:hypothetical protein